MLLKYWLNSQRIWHSFTAVLLNRTHLFFFLWAPWSKYWRPWFKNMKFIIFKYSCVTVWNEWKIGWTTATSYRWWWICWSSWLCSGASPWTKHHKLQLNVVFFTLLHEKMSRLAWCSSSGSKWTINRRQKWRYVLMIHERCTFVIVIAVFFPQY